MMKKRFSVFTAALLLTLVALCDEPKKAHRAKEKIAPGVVYEQISDPAGPWEVRLIRIDKEALKKYEFRVSEAGDVCPGLESTLDAFNRAKAKKLKVIAAVNGDSYYYRDKTKLGQPRALTVVDGRFFSIGDLRSRANLFVDAADRLSIGRGSMNGSTVSIGEKSYPLVALNDILVAGYEGVDGVFAYTSDWGRLHTPAPGIAVQLKQPYLTIPGEFKGHVEGAFPVGAVSGEFSKVVLVGFGSAAEINSTPAKTTVRMNIAISPAPKNPPLKLALGAMGIIRQGEQTFFKDSGGLARHPRTFWGCGPDCVVFGVVDGRQKGWSVGMTYEEMDNLLKPYKLTNILNLDGGGSTTLVIDGKIQNKPSDGAPRRTGNHLLLIRRP